MYMREAARIVFILLCLGNCLAIWCEYLPWGRRNHLLEGFKLSLHRFSWAFSLKLMALKFKLDLGRFHDASNSPDLILADTKLSVNNNQMPCLVFFMSKRKREAMKRYEHLQNSDCLRCGKWLCVMAGTYTGEINCPSCGAANVFTDSSKPC